MEQGFPLPLMLCHVAPVPPWGCALLQETNEDQGKHRLLSLLVRRLKKKVCGSVAGQQREGRLASKRKALVPLSLLAGYVVLLGCGRMPSCGRLSVSPSSAWLPPGTSQRSQPCPPAPSPAPSLPCRTVVFPDAPAQPMVRAQWAHTPPEVERGLMYRTHLAEEEGMLFGFAEKKVHVFWMRHTCIPLDMIFADEKGSIVGIIEKAAPLSEQPLQVPQPSVWVLEVKGGWTRRHRVTVGQRMWIKEGA